MAANSKSSGNLNKALSALILLLLFGGGGWAVWHYLVAGSGELSASAAAGLTDSNVDGPPLPRAQGQGPGRRQGPRPPNFGQFAARLGANLPDGIMPAGNAYLVKSGNTRLDVQAANNGNRGDWRYRFSYAMADLPSPEQAEAIRAARRAVSDPAAAEKLGATQAQILQLRDVPNNNGMLVTNADRANVATLFRAWLVASGRFATTASSATSRPIQLPPPTPESKAAEQKLISALGNIGTQQLEPTRQSYASRAQRIHSILGDGLLQKLKPAG